MNGVYFYRLTGRCAQSHLRLSPSISTHTELNSAIQMANPGEWCPSIDGYIYLVTDTLAEKSRASSAPSWCPFTDLSPEPQYLKAQDRFWDLYLKEAERKDKERLERWRVDIDGILIFVRDI